MMKKFLPDKRVKDMGNKWISFLKSWRAKNKGVSLRDSMKKASVEYKKSGAGSKTTKTAKTKTKRKTKKKNRKIK